jgi:hypothetical protein
MSDVVETQEQATEEIDQVETEDQDAETFPAEVVHKLRDENAKLRIKAKRSDELAQQLHTELVRATGRLADPTDLEYNEEHLADPEKLTGAIDSLLTAKPHLKSRKVTGDVNQGNRAAAEAPKDFSALLRA